MKFRSRRSLSTLTVGALISAPLVVASPAHAADPVNITLVDINDFHGRIDSNTTKFATTVEQIRAAAGEENTLFLSVGDNIGASPFASATQQDTPTLEVLNALDLQVSAVGNHEFDRGFADLTGRVGTDGESGEAAFPYLGANVMQDGVPALDASATFTVAGLKVAVIGAVTEETPTLVSPGGISGLTFTDPVEAVNDEADRLNALPEDEKPDVIVAAYHEGAGAGTPENATLEQEVASGGAFANIVNNTDASIDAIFTGHTHKVYAWQAPIPGDADSTRPIIQTGSYGANIGKTVLSVDPDTAEVTASTVENVPRVSTADTTLPRVAEVDAITDAALDHAAEIGNEPVASITADITRAFSGGSFVDGKYTGGTTDDRASESTLGNLVPDAMLAQSQGTNAPADLALNNPGGLRNSELFYAGDTTENPANTDGVVTFAEANTILPFTNNLYTVTLTGAQLKQVFEQQWQRDASGNVPSRPYLQLGMSDNVRYTYDATRDEGDRITSIWVDDELIDPATSYRVIAPSFLALGGDNFRAFAEGSWVDTGVVDYEGWIDYLGDNSPVAPDFGRRAVAVTGLQDVYETAAEVSFSLPKLNLTSLGSPENTSVAATLEYGDGETFDLGSQAVTAGASGTFTFTLPQDVVGEATITAQASPSGTVATIPLVVKAASELEIEAPDQVTKSDTVDVRVAVSTVDGYEASGTVTLSEGSTTLGSAEVTDGAAVFELAAADLRLGQHTLTATYSGDADVSGSSATAVVEVIKGETAFSASGSTTPYGTSATITLTADPGTTGVVYVVNPLGITVGTAFLTDGKGTFTFGRTALKPGWYSYRLFFNGSASYEPADAQVTVKVTKASTTTAAKVAKKTTTKKRTTMIVKVSAKGFAPTGKVVVKRGNTTVGRGTVKNGIARVKLAKLRKGKATLTVVYGGSAVAYGSTTTATIRVVR